MTATILSFGRRQPNTPLLPAKMPWQKQDLAELYRVRDRLCAAGLDVEVEAGVTDEGDPWFVYVQAGTDNVVVHIARIDSEIHVINCVTGGTYTGTSFREVSDRMLEDAPLALSAQVRRGSNVVLHPSAFLTAFVAAAIMLIDLLEHGRAEAATHHGDDMSMPDGAHGHTFFLETRGGSDSAGSPEATSVSTEAVQTGDVSDGTASRRIGKESPVTAQSIVGLGSTTAIAPVGLASAAPAHIGFLAEVPGVGASVTLAAGILAAEFARSFTAEEKHSSIDTGDRGFVHEFASLLTAFVSVEGAHAKGLSNEAAKDGAVALNSAPIGIASTTVDLPSAPSHADAAPKAEMSTTPSVKSVPDGVVEHAVFSPPPPSPIQKPIAQSAPVNQAAGAAAATTDAGHAAGASSDASSANVTAPVTIAPTSSASSAASSTSALKADATKDAAALDLTWIVSQLVKHDAADGTIQKPAVSVGALGLAGMLKDGATDKGGEASSLPSSSKTATDHSLKPADDGKPSGSELKTGDTKTDATKLPIGSHDTGSLDTPTDSAKGNAVDTGKATAHGTTLTPAGGTITLEAGHHETVVYKAGSTLVLQGFVFGEDYLSFDAKLGDAMAAKAHADGADLVLGDADIGTVRLVGVLADPDLLSHHGGTQATAA